MAAMHFAEAVRLLHASDATPAMKEILELAFSIGAAECHAVCEDWWSLVRTIEVRAIVGMPVTALIMAHKLLATGLMRLGLLTHSSCINTLDEAARLAVKHAPSQPEIAALQAEHAARTAAIADGGGLAAEIGILAIAFGLGASKELTMVTSEIRSVAGRRKLCDTGLLDEADVEAADARSARDAMVGERTSLRAQHRLLTYHVKKRFEDARTTGVVAREASEDGNGGISRSNGLPSGLSGGVYHCVAPCKLLRPGVQPHPPLLTAAQLATLQAERFVVVDGAVALNAIMAAASEVRQLKQGGMLKTDPNDVCNPQAAAFDMPLWRQKFTETLEAECPGLCGVKNALYSLPPLLEEELGLPLRVPQTMMLSAYPAGAFYRRHYDSYEGKDIPRLVTILLYLAYSPARAGHLRVEMPSTGGGTRDIAPTPGRLVIFYAQEVAHEVLASEGERLAVTLWLWDMKKDQHGR